MRSEAKKEQYMGSNIDTKSPPLIGRDQQIDDSFSYSESKSQKSDTNSDTKSQKSAEDILDFLKDNGSNNTTGKTAMKINAKEKTQFDFLDTDEDEDSFKPLDLGENRKNEGFDFLNSENSGENSDGESIPDFLNDKSEKETENTATTEPTYSQENTEQDTESITQNSPISENLDTENSESEKSE